jgi:hypothetical protein
MSFFFLGKFIVQNMREKRIFLILFWGKKNYQIHHIERQKELLNLPYLDIAFQLVARI